MRISREALIWKALLVIDDAIEAAGRGPVPPSLGLRLALATIYALGDGPREPFDSFWATVTASYEGVTQGNYQRAIYARTHACIIARSVGVEMTAPMIDRLRQARLQGRREAMVPLQPPRLDQE